MLVVFWSMTRWAWMLAARGAQSPSHQWAAARRCRTDACRNLSVASRALRGPRAAQSTSATGLSRLVPEFTRMASTWAVDSTTRQLEAQSGGQAAAQARRQSRPCFQCLRTQPRGRAGRGRSSCHGASPQGQRASLRFVLRRDAWVMRSHVEHRAGTPMWGGRDHDNGPGHRGGVPTRWTRTQENFLTLVHTPVALISAARRVHARGQHAHKHRATPARRWSGQTRTVQIVAPVLRRMT